MESNLIVTSGESIVCLLLDHTASSLSAMTVDNNHSLTHGSTFHVIETPALITQPSVTSPTLLKLSSQCYLNGPGNLGNLSNSTEIQFDTTYGANLSLRKYIS